MSTKFIINYGHLQKAINVGEVVEIPEQVSVIDIDAFRNCRHLKKVIFPNSLTEIHSCAFRDCTNLNELIGLKGAKITVTAFKGCRGLADENGFLLIGKTLAEYFQKDTQQVVIPQKVKRIAPNVFRLNQNIHSVILPDGLTEIGSYAFAGCRNLQKVELPQSITKIGTCAFFDCRSLEISVPATVQDIGDDAFTDCCSAKCGNELLQNRCESCPNDFLVENGVLRKYFGKAATARVPEGVHTIGNEATWSPCTAKIILSEGVTKLGWNSMQNCRNLISLKVPSTLRDTRGAFGIEQRINLEAEDLKHYMETIVTADHDLYIDNKHIEDVNLDFVISKIPDEAFANCRNLRRVIIPDGIDTIGYGAFRGCEELREALLPNTLKEISKDAFYGCSNLSSIMLPASLQSIGEEAFSGCDGLTSVSGSESVKNMGPRAFKGCKKLADSDGFLVVNGTLFNYYGTGGSVVIPQGIKRIDNYTLSYRTDIVSVKIPDSLKSIGFRAFHATEITDIKIPEGVESIEDEAFACCKCLTEVILPDSAKNIGKNIFEECEKLQIISMPKPENISLPSKCSCGVCLTGEKSQFLAYSSKSENNNLDDYIFAESPNWEIYDLEIINNGPKYKYSLPARLMGAVGRLMDPVDLKDENKQFYREFLIKNVKKVISFAESQDKPEIIEMLYDQKIINGDNKKTIQKLISASTNAQIAKFAEIEISDISIKTEKKQEKKKDTVSSEFTILFKEAGGEKAIRSMKLIGREFPSVKLESGEVAPADLLKYIIICYGTQKPSSFSFSEGADAAAKLLSYDSLCDAIDHLSDHLDGPNYPAMMPVLCRFGNRSQIKELISKYQLWDNWSLYGKKGRTARELFPKALALSDTHEAVVWLEENYHLFDYARIRRTTQADIKEQYLFNFGFDRTGKKIYKLENTIIEVTIDKELNLSLYDKTNKKRVNNIPKQGIDPAVQKKAADDLSDLRANIKKAVRIKTDQLYEDYLAGEYVESESWKRNYLSNPLLHAVAELLVWEQDGCYFTLGTDGSIDSFGKDYPITDESISLAHPMNMKTEEITNWQKYFSSHSLKQPFQQVWEPVYSHKEICDDRYKGIPIPYYYLKNQEKRGIHIEWWSNEWTGKHDFKIRGFETKVREENRGQGEQRFEILFLKPILWNRRANMIIAFLDQLTVSERVRKDDMNLLDQIQHFTLAQITEMIKIAQDCNAVNVLPLLMEHKNKYYSDFDPMDEFVLE